MGRAEPKAGTRSLWLSLAGARGPKALGHPAAFPGHREGTRGEVEQRDRNRCPYGMLVVETVAPFLPRHSQSICVHRISKQSTSCTTVFPNSVFLFSFCLNVMYDLLFLSFFSARIHVILCSWIFHCCNILLFICLSAARFQSLLLLWLT